MGCATSKQKVCENCQSPISPVPRSYSMHVHHLPQTKGDSYHMVALTSSTLGALKLDRSYTTHCIKEDLINPGENNGVNEPDQKVINKEDHAMDMIEAKTWSKMIEEKIPKMVPKTPTQTPPGEPETINAWELMEGLEDSTPLRSPDNNLRSFSFHVSANEYGDQTPKPMWSENISDNNSHLHSDSTSEYDPEVILTFRKALEELPPANPFHLKPMKNENGDETLKKAEGVVVEEYKPPHSKEKLVLYFTSLRGVRKTYEECCHVRVILNGLRVKIDERDVSMHSGFKEELKELLGEGYPGGGLPKVFLGSKCIGGAEEIRRMNELGQLEKVVANCEKVDDRGGGEGGGGNGGVVCESCGDITFVPCHTCSGSCKIYCEGDYNSDEYEEDDYGFQRCPDCNENGLIRCPLCCD